MASEGRAHWGAPPPHYNYHLDLTAVAALQARLARPRLALREPHVRCLRHTLLSHGTFAPALLDDLTATLLNASGAGAGADDARARALADGRAGEWPPLVPLPEAALSRAASAALRAAADRAAPPDLLARTCAPAPDARARDEGEAPPATSEEWAARLAGTRWAWADDGFFTNGEIELGAGGVLRSSFDVEPSRWRVANASARVVLERIGAVVGAELAFNTRATGFVKARDASQRGVRQSTRGYLLDAGFDSPDAAGAPCAFPGDAVG